MSLRYHIPFDLDSPERMRVHRDILMRKPFLKRIFQEWYLWIKQQVDKLPNGQVVELGSGGGFLKEVITDVTTSDIIPLDHTDLTFSALDMPFTEGQISGLLMVDTFHHIPDAGRFLQEASRVLKPGGAVIMIEPANSWWGRLIYQQFHHEPFDPSGGWTFPTSGPMSGANGALPWIVFERDKKILSKRFPEFQVVEIKYHTPLCYLLSGGLTLKSLVPTFSYSFFRFLDKCLAKISPHFSMFVSIVVRKTNKDY